MECHLEIARENWEIFFSFLGKDYDQRDHHDDHSPGMNMSFLHLLSSFRPLEILAVSLNRILHPTLLSVTTDGVRVTPRVLQTPHWSPCSHSCPYTEQCFSNINSTLSLMSKPCSGFPSLLRINSRCCLWVDKGQASMMWPLLGSVVSAPSTSPNLPHDLSPLNRCAPTSTLPQVPAFSFFLEISKFISALSLCTVPSTCLLCPPLIMGQVPPTPPPH